MESSTYTKNLYLSLLTLILMGFIDKLAMVIFTKVVFVGTAIAPIIYASNVEQNLFI